jgi:quercetin dioxygenase-like cupin family protein
MQTSNAMPTDAERTAFVSRLEREGFDEILTKTLEANVVIELHSHPYDVLALVLDGEATIDCGGGARTFRPGDVLEVAADQPHTEHYGPKGYTFLLGRRHKAA